MTLKIKVSIFALLTAMFLITSCGGKKDTGTVGETYSFTIEAADATSDTEYQWIILDQPLSSILSQEDLTFSNDFRTMFFFPEFEGLYSFQALTLQYGDTITIQTFEVDILEGESSRVENEDYVEDESWLNDPDIQASSDKPEEPVEAKIENESVKEAVVTEIVIPAPEKPVRKQTPIVEKPKRTGPAPGSSIPAVKGKYTIQVSSWSSLPSAEKEYTRLVQEGFDAYVQRAYFRENGQTWYRVRVGSYGNYDQAAKVSKTVSASLGVEAWVDFVRKDQ